LRSLNLIRRRDYDLVIVSDKFLFGAISVLIARWRRVPFIFWLTFPYPELDIYGAKVRTARYPAIARIRGMISGAVLYRWILPRSAWVFVQSSRMAKDVATHGVDPSKMSPILTGFGLKDISFARPQAHTGTRTIAYLGTLSADRRLEVLIDALAELRKLSLDVRLLLIGHADRDRDRRLLEERARSLGVAESLEITGFMPQREALQRLAGADVALSPIVRSPIYDVGSPTKLIEYLALGVPVVANDHPEQREILNQSRAGVCVPWGGRYFARGIRWLLARPQAEILEMSQRGRHWVETHRTYKVIADDVEQRCLSVIERSRQRDSASTS
jgi:glycosyltransferase involved in cell wall biosynthesis